MTRQEVQAKLDKAKSNTKLTDAQRADLVDLYTRLIAKMDAEEAAAKSTTEAGEGTGAAPKKGKGKKKGKSAKKAEAPAEGAADCEDLEKSAKKAAAAGYDFDEVISGAIERKKKAKAAAAKRASEPKKSAATKNKEAVTKTAAKVTTNVEKRAEKGEVTEAEVLKLIAVYEESLKELKELLKRVKAGATKKMAKGGRTEDEIALDNKYSSLKAGLRHSHKYATVEMRGGDKYTKRNANQFGKSDGKGTYREGRANRTDKKRFQ